MNRPLFLFMLCLMLSACIQLPADDIPSPPRAPAFILPDSAAKLPSAPVYRPAKRNRESYFDAQGEPSAEAVGGGFFRRLLGKTEEGAAVVQDFYQDSQSPYTLPFVLNDAEDWHKFRADPQPAALFYPDGTLYMMSDSHNNNQRNETWFFRDKKPLAHIRENPTHTAGQIRFFNRQGQMIASADISPQQRNLSLFYPHGMAMLHIQDTPDHSLRQAWDNSGKPLLPIDISSEINRVSADIRTILRDINRPDDALMLTALLKP